MKFIIKGPSQRHHPYGREGNGNDRNLSKDHNKRPTVGGKTYWSVSQLPHLKIGEVDDVREDQGDTLKKVKKSKKFPKCARKKVAATCRHEEYDLEFLEIQTADNGEEIREIREEIYGINEQLKAAESRAANQKNEQEGENQKLKWMAMKVEADAKDLLDTQVKMVGIIQKLSDEMHNLRGELKSLAEGQEAGSSKFKAQQGQPQISSSYMKELFPLDHARLEHEEAMNRRKRPSWVRSGREECRPFQEWRRKPYAAEHIPPPVNTRKKYARTSIALNVYEDNEIRAKGADDPPPIAENSDIKDEEIENPTIPTNVNDAVPEIQPKSPSRKIKLKLRLRRSGNTLKACQ